MIYTNIPYAPKECDKNIGCAYNKFMELLPNDDDWACFLDHDAMFTTSTWYNQLNDIIRKHPTIGAFGARINRVAYPWQLIGNIDIDNHDMIYHRSIGNHLQKKYYYKVSPGSLCGHNNQPGPSRFSGTLILVKKSTWKVIGGFKQDGFLAVDDDFRERLATHNIQFGIMDGVYLYHWYRADNPYETSAPMLDKVRALYADFIKNNKFDLNKITLLE